MEEVQWINGPGTRSDLSSEEYPVPVYLDHEERRTDATPEDTKREGRRGHHEGPLVTLVAHSKGIHRVRMVSECRGVGTQQRNGND